MLEWDMPMALGYGGMFDQIDIPRFLNRLSAIVAVFLRQSQPTYAIGATKSSFRPYRLSSKGRVIQKADFL